MPRSTRSLSATLLLTALLSLLGGCRGETPERATILDVQLLDTPAGPQLEVTQHLRFSPTMLDALSSGIPLRLLYGIEACGRRYAALTHSYELRQQTGRFFDRRSAMLAALDRVRLPLPESPPANCSGRIALSLDLTSLPTPLRFPALLQPDHWRMVSPPATWPAARA